MDIVIIEIDLGKNSCSLAGMERVRPSSFEAPDADGVRLRVSRRVLGAA